MTVKKDSTFSSDNEVGAGGFGTFGEIGKAYKGTFTGEATEETAKYGLQRRWQLENTSELIVKVSKKNKEDTIDGVVSEEEIGSVLIAFTYAKDKVTNAKKATRVMNQLNKLKRGDIVGIAYTSDFDTGTANPAKTYKVFKAGVDEAWLKANPLTPVATANEEISVEDIPF